MQDEAQEQLDAVYEALEHRSSIIPSPLAGEGWDGGAEAGTAPERHARPHPHPCPPPSRGRESARPGSPNDYLTDVLDIDVMPDTLQLRIAETIVRLPEDVANFALHNIHWRLFEPTWRGVTYLLPERPPSMVATYEEWRTLVEQRQSAPALERRWLVVLNHDLVADDADPEAARGTIAHETAHAVLGHSCCLAAMTPPLGFEEKECAADRLATDWGFACWPSWVDADQAGAQ